MRLPEDYIKQALLHEEEEVRLTALAYFADPRLADPTIMPLVVQAAEQYGLNNAFRLLRDAEPLPHTGDTLDWILEQLDREFDISDPRDDNLRYALALSAVWAAPELLRPRQARIARLESFPDVLRVPLHERLQMDRWTAAQGWSALLDLGRTTMRKRTMSDNESRYARRVIESLARHADELGERVTDALWGSYGSDDPALMQWLEPEFMRLAGQMRLASSISILVRRLEGDDPTLADEASAALIRIGGDAVVEEIARTWWDADDEFCISAAFVLEQIHTDKCVDACLDFIQDEEDWSTAIELGHALLSHFAAEGIEEARAMAETEGDEFTPSHAELRYHLVAAATIMDVDFPEYDEWHDEAVAMNYGSHDDPTFRIAEIYRSEPVGPRRSGNGKH